MDDFFARPQKREPDDLNIVPIIDMLTAVIFFVLLSTTFIAFTKVTVPPSRTVANTDVQAPPPVAPKFFVFRNGPVYELLLSWSGADPGESLKRVTGGANELPENFRLASEELAKKFHAKFPREQSIQLGMSSEIPYQSLISVMDGIRTSLPDVVLVSYDEVDANARGRRAAPAKGES